MNITNYKNAIGMKFKCNFRNEISFVAGRMM